MISELDLATLGARIDLRATGPAVDRRGWFAPTDGVLRAYGPPEATATVRQGVDERAAIAAALVDGTHPKLEMIFGRCVACAQPIRADDAGTCALCRAAVQRERTARGLPIGLAASGSMATAPAETTRAERDAFLRTVSSRNAPGVDYPRAPWEVATRRDGGDDRAVPNGGKETEDTR